ncbi:unnamed protein product [Camellia sinensis]
MNCSCLKQVLHLLCNYLGVMQCRSPCSLDDWLCSREDIEVMAHKTGVEARHVVRRSREDFDVGHQKLNHLGPLYGRET